MSKKIFLRQHTYTTYIFRAAIDCDSPRVLWTWRQMVNKTVEVWRRHDKNH